jgi:hypothetical protein
MPINQIIKYDSKIPLENRTLQKYNTFINETWAEREDSPARTEGGVTQEGVYTQYNFGNVQVTIGGVEFFSDPTRSRDKVHSEPLAFAAVINKMLADPAAKAIIAGLMPPGTPLDPIDTNQIVSGSKDEEEANRLVWLAVTKYQNVFKNQNITTAVFTERQPCVSGTKKKSESGNSSGCKNRLDMLLKSTDKIFQAFGACDPQEFELQIILCHANRAREKATENEFHSIAVHLSDLIHTARDIKENIDAEKQLDEIIKELQFAMIDPDGYRKKQAELQRQQESSQKETVPEVASNQKPKTRAARERAKKNRDDKEAQRLAQSTRDKDKSQREKAEKAVPSENNKENNQQAEPEKEANQEALSIDTARVETAHENKHTKMVSMDTAQVETMYENKHTETAENSVTTRPRSKSLPSLPMAMGGIASAVSAGVGYYTGVGPLGIVLAATTGGAAGFALTSGGMNLMKRMNANKRSRSESASDREQNTTEKERTQEVNPNLRRRVQTVIGDLPKPLSPSEGSSVTTHPMPARSHHKTKSKKAKALTQEPSVAPLPVNSSLKNKGP